jgi:hypothetical protein
MMGKLVALSFLVIGVVVFLLATRFLGDTSETALVQGSMGLIPGVLGFVGGMIGRRGVGRAALFGLLFSVLGGGLLMVFYQVIWPML